MKAIVYISEAKIEFDEDSLHELADKAATQNAQHGIMGYLWYKKGQFIQYIEGETPTLDLLMARIVIDDRHEVLHYTEDFDLSYPRFPNWSMRYFSAQDPLEIQLENFLCELLMVMKTTNRGETLVNNVWRIVNSIALQV